MSAFCEHPENRRCCPACCHHCYLDSQGVHQSIWEREDTWVPEWLLISPNVRLVTRVLDPSPYGNQRAWLFALEPLVINNHGIHGLMTGGGTGYDFTPQVCLGCSFRSFDFDDREYSSNSWDFCERGLKKPVRKGTCKVYEREVASKRA